MDELAYSLNGENMHYGTPTNPACPDRIPGGSSSGSAVATADGDVDFALGSDTGGEHDVVLPLLQGVRQQCCIVSSVALAFLHLGGQRTQLHSERGVNFCLGCGER